jgi:hypothetical protein
VSPLSPSVSRRHLLLSLNVSPNRGLLVSPGVYVCEPLHVGIGIALKQPPVLLQALDSWQHTGQRPVSSGVAISHGTYHDTKGRPACLLAVLSRRLPGNVPTETLTDPGISPTAEPIQRRDVTLALSDATTSSGACLISGLCCPSMEAKIGALPERAGQLVSPGT